MFKSFLLGCVLLGLSFAFAPSAWAAVYVTIKNPVEVYEDPSEMSTILGTFKAGTRLLVSDKDAEGWRKVTFMDRGKKRIAWVRTVDIQDGVFSPGTSGKLKKQDVGLPASYKDNRGIGASIVGTYARQNERSITLSDDISVYNISSLTSMTFWLAVFYDWPLSQKWVLRPFVSYRSIHFKGEATLQGIGGAADSTSTTDIQQTYLGAGLTAKSYFEASPFWWGVGIEAGKNMAIKISQGGQDVPVTEEDKPFFFFPYAAFGWDKALSKKFYFVPEAKLGAATSLKPMAYIFETHFSIAYQW